jgi:hypothetical protein
MKIRKIIPFVLQAPFILIMVASFFASIYAAVYHISGITFATPVILGVIVVLYFYGRYLGRKK